MRNPFEINDRVINTRKHSRSHIVYGTVVAVKNNLIDVRYDKIERIPDVPKEFCFPVDTVGTSAHFLWIKEPHTWVVPAKNTPSSITEQAAVDTVRYCRCGRKLGAQNSGTTCATCLTT